MERRDAGKKAGRLEQAGKVGGGTAEDTGAARQASTAPGEHAGEEASELMEEVLRRENLMAAYRRVVPRLKPDPKSVKRLKSKLKELFRRGRGWSLGRTIRELNPILRGWAAYYRLADVSGVFEELDQWIRRRLRLILWRQWKRPRTRRKELRKRGLGEERAAVSAYNGRGPWWNAGASHMNEAVPNSMLSRMGLVNLLHEQRRLECTL